MRSACYVIKFGGSVITNKAGAYELLNDPLVKIAKVLKEKEMDLPLILIFGGGSFGNLAPLDYKVLERQGDRASLTLPMMTVTMFSMLSEITKIFVAHSLPVYPLQTSALTCAERGSEISLDARVIKSAIDCGFIPLLTGDLVFEGSDNYGIFSSDNIPYLLSKEFEIARVLYYTDVEGLYEPANGNQIVSYVDSSNFRAMQNAAGSSSYQDITGGMRNKFVQQRLLASSGIESEVLSFQYFDCVCDSLKGAKRYGTVFLPG